MIDKHSLKHYVKNMVQKGTFWWLMLATILALVWVSVPVWAAGVSAANASRPGETFDLKPLLVKGKINVVDFYSPFCPPCVQLAPVMEQLAARRPDLAIHKININRPGVQGIDWRSPLAQQYKIRQVPYFMIFNPQGKLLAQGRGAGEQVQSWLREAGLMR